MNIWERIITPHLKQKQYPAENFVRFVARNFYKARDRSKIHFLDLGCGPGANSWYLAHEGFRVTALDVSAAAIASLKYRFSEEKFNANIAYVQSDILQWDYPNSVFNCVVDHNVLCHVEHPPIQKIHDSLISGGKFFSVCPANDTWRGTLVNKGFCRCARRDELRELYAPFTDLRIRRMSYPDGKYTIVSWIVEATK